MKKSLAPLVATVAGVLYACGGGPPPPPASSRPAPAVSSAAPSAKPATVGPRKDLPSTAYQVAWGAFDVPAKLRPREETRVKVRLKNASPVVWPGGAGTAGLLHTIRLSSRWLQESKTIVPYTTRAELPTVVNPGDEVVVELLVAAPAARGRYRLQFDLIHEGVAYFEGMGSDTKFFEVQVGK